MKAQQCQHESVQWGNSGALLAIWRYPSPLIALPQILHMKMCLGIHAYMCIFGVYTYVHVCMYMLLSFQNPLLWAVTSA